MKILNDILTRNVETLLYSFRPHALLKNLEKEIEAKALGHNKVHLIGIGKLGSHYIEELLHNKKIKFSNVLSLTSFDGLTDNASFTQLVSSHPHPSLDGVEESNEVIYTLEGIEKDDLIVFIVSGGSSAMLVRPIHDLEWGDFAKMWDQLLFCGRPIEEINQARMLMSQLKAGGLLDYTKCTNILNLYISDVSRNDFDIIGSAPTNRVEIDYPLVKDIVNSLDVRQAVKDTLFNHYESGEWARKRESLKEKNIENFLVVSPHLVQQNITKYLEETFTDFEVISQDCVVSNSLEKSLEYFEMTLPQLCEKHDKFIHVSIGESSVRRGESKGGFGGRCSHLVSELAYQFYDQDKYKGLSFYALASDGVDGNSDGAGGWLNYDAYQKIGEEKLEDAIGRFDTATLLEEYDCAYHINKLRMNFMDIRIIVYDKEE
jgi:glycerate 2-kinase